MIFPVDHIFSDAVKHRLFRLMQAVLLGILAAGLYGQDPGVIVNSVVALTVTFLPAYLARNYDIAMRPAIVLWITAAVSLHALGTLGLYRIGSIHLLGVSIGWDSITHTLSASVVAGVGYATVSALDEYDENIHLPQRFMFLFILIFVMAFGVFWEVLEFLIAEVADSLGMVSVLTQYGLEDTIKDLMFDMVGAIVFALLGTDYVQHLINDMHKRLEYRELIRVNAA